MSLWAAVFAASLRSPALLDDADATHAQAAQAMLRTGDYVTLHVNGIRYLEKPPLPYWIAAGSMRVFGENSFAVHLPLALTVLGLALLGFFWSRQAFSERAALYTGLMVLTSAGVFLFTRIFIPDALLSLLLATSLWAMLQALDESCGWRVAAAYVMWAALALALLTKGLVALLFFFATATIFLWWTKNLRNVGRLRPFSGVLLLLAIAAPWHVLAGLRNTGGEGGHGFFWFYFVNEHFLRFLGRRIPRDYNKLPAIAYWCLHLVWLFPWSLFAPAALLFGWRSRHEQMDARDRDGHGELVSRFAKVSQRQPPLWTSFGQRTTLLLSIFSVLVLVFFASSTNQEYYTFPVYLPLLMMLAATLAGAESMSDTLMQKTIRLSYALFALIGFAIAAALGYGLWSARKLAFVPDIGSVLAHRGVGNYTLSMSHFFDLTGPSFAALRLPATIAAIAFAVGPIAAWLLNRKAKRPAAFMMVAATSATFLIAAHLALVRFAPMLSSQDFAATIQRLEAEHLIETNSNILIYGDQAFGSSIPFYLGRRVSLVDGRSTSMLFGSSFPDAPRLFVTHEDLAALWGKGPRRILFVTPEQRGEVERLLRDRAIVMAETSGKTLMTDRPLETQLLEAH